MLPEVHEEELVELYAWVDSIPLSRPKKFISRDFADGVLASEVVAHYFPRMVELHNYIPTSNSAQKVSNWTTLNNRVFKKLGFTLPRHICEAVAFGEAGTVERVLKLIRTKLAAYQAKHGASRAAQLHQQHNGASTASPGATSYGLASPSPSPSPAKKNTATGAANGAGNANAQSPARAVVVSPNGLIRSYAGGIATAHNYSTNDLEDNSINVESMKLRAELAESHSLVRLLEDKCGKMESLLRLKDAKIAALTARLEASGLLVGVGVDGAAGR